MLRAASCLLPKWLLALRYVYNRKGQICEILVYDASSPKKESSRSRILATLRGREEIPLTKRFPNTSNHKLMVWSPTCPCLTVSYDNLWDGCSSLLQPLAWSQCTFGFRAEFFPLHKLFPLKEVVEWYSSGSWVTKCSLCSLQHDFLTM